MWLPEHHEGPVIINAISLDSVALANRRQNVSPLLPREWDTGKWLPAGRNEFLTTCQNHLRKSGTSTRLIASLLPALVGGFWHTLLINSAHGCRAHRRRRGYLPPAYPRAGSPVRPARAAQPHRRSGSVFIWLLVARDKGTSRDVRRRFH